ncbi:TetR/AcrR family transcriptional regulator [Curvivirga aplysinae]|uniref:TetR/AcrR family transcriptional regulator n=1 Tax=Curvivirga aplysinae TaxID=2529852 RepID=UPI0012BD0446|nr:TetR/AcrR family transcriptional regulator [Curvivirga aplysinae]MTI10286.1 TetR/AcrR family transcriptional regulator [Curvivirga aplysinae]
MPLSATHKAETRKKIVTAARELFNRYGFSSISIDEIMARAGLTRGGFYAHFKNKASLYAEAITSIRQRHEETGLMERCMLDPEVTREAIAGFYLSPNHRDNREEGCPLPALVSDVSRENDTVKAAYTDVFQNLSAALAGKYDGSKVEFDKLDDKAIADAVLCVGGQIISRAINDKETSDRILKACYAELLTRNAK